MANNLEREKEIFSEALELASPEARGAFLRDACGSDHDLREKVEALLAAFEAANKFIPTRHDYPAQCPQPTEASIPITEQPGDQIGRYKLLEKLGEGGFGVVYMAEQREPVKRRVALKIIKVGMDTREVVARFEAERQALAMMDHPNIAKVHDGGATDTGRPYFVMELVRGIKLTEYCDEQNVSTRERLELFVQVCQAVQHAHQKGIIHRDLKPSNILVTVNDGKPDPKIIDFGIAKATQMELTEKTVFTRFQQFLGTPAYMSPEQAYLSSVDIDTRSDIYSLGVLLYELLTGKTPFDGRELLKAGLDEMRRTIREKEPERPSTKVSTLRGDELTTTAKRRGLDAFKLIHVLRGDLDWIVMKCLEKDRARRYETANGLMADIQRHLNSEPVVARPPSAAYRFQKMVRRNRVAFVAGIAIFVALAVGLGFALWQSLEKSRAYRRTLAAEREQRVLRQQAEASARTAQDEAAKSQQVSKFLKDMLRGVRPSVARGRDTTMLREILDRTTQRLGDGLRERPEVQAEILSTLAHSHEDLGLVKQAEKLYRESLRLYESVHGRDHPVVAGAMVDLSSVLNQKSQADDSEALNREALAIYRKHYGSNSLTAVPALINIALAYMRRDDTANEESYYRQAIGIYDQHPGREDEDLAFALHNLAASRHNQRDYEQAAKLAARCAEVNRKLLAHETALANALQLAGQSYYRRKDYAKAEPCLRESLTIRRVEHGVAHERTIDALTWLSLTLAAQGSKKEGPALVQEMMAAERQLWANQPDKLSQALAGDADLLARFGQFTEAVSLYRERINHLLERFPADHPDVLKAKKRLEEFEQRLKTEKQPTGADP